MRAGAVENSPLWYGDRTREDYGVLEVGTEAQSTRAVEWSRARKGEEVSSRARKKAVVGWNRDPLACAPHARENSWWWHGARHQW